MVDGGEFCLTRRKWKPCECGQCFWRSVFRNFFVVTNRNLRHILGQCCHARLTTDRRLRHKKPRVFLHGVFALVLRKQVFESPSFLGDASCVLWITSLNMMMICGAAGHEHRFSQENPFSSSSTLHPKKECKWNGPSCKHKSPCIYGQKNGQTCQRFLSRKKNRATEKPKLDNARRLREIYQTAPEDLELEECLEEGVKKIESHMESAMPCKSQTCSGKKNVKTSKISPQELSPQEIRQAFDKQSTTLEICRAEVPEQTRLWAGGGGELAGTCGTRALGHKR